MLLNDSQRGVVTSTYGRQALEQLRDVVRTAKADDAMATVTILLPGWSGVLVGQEFRRGDEVLEPVCVQFTGSADQLREQPTLPRGLTPARGASADDEGTSGTSGAAG